MSLLVVDPEVDQSRRARALLIALEVDRVSVVAVWETEGVKVTQQGLHRVRPGNLRVTVLDFSEVWAASEDQVAARGRVGVTDWHAGGIAITCRWVAGAVTEFRGRRRSPLSPVTQRWVAAFEETIEAEYLAALLLSSRPDAALVSERPGYVNAVIETLAWCWRREGPPPIAGRDTEHQATSQT